MFSIKFKLLSHAFVVGGIRLILTKVTMPRLAAFDFDHTIIADNSDMVIMDMIPESFRPPCSQGRRGWLEYRKQCFLSLQTHGITADEICEKIRKLTPITGMVDLLGWLFDANYHIIIISDSNSLFINEWLMACNLAYTIRKTFTNPAEFLSDGRLLVSMFEEQENCLLSSVNLCKGNVLQNYIDTNGPFEQVMYCGDGYNDLCPILRLGPNDLACVRQGYTCQEYVRKIERGEELKGQFYTLTASLLEWNTGFDILQHLQKTV